MQFSSKIERTYNWLNAERAQAIVSLAKKHEADSVKRLAQERGALGICKVVVQFNRHSWAASLEAIKPFDVEVKEAGLINSLT